MRYNFYTILLINFEKFQKRFLKKYTSAVPDFLKFLNHGIGILFLLCSYEYNTKRMIKKYGGGEDLTSATNGLRFVLPGDQL